MDWGKTHGHFYYGEYNSYGPGASPETRADFSHQLTREEAEQYSMEKVLEEYVRHQLEGLGNEFTGKRELRRVEAAVFHKVE